MGLIYSALFFSLRLYGAAGAVQTSHKLLCALDSGAPDTPALEGQRVQVLKQWAVLSALGIWESLGEPLLSWVPFYATIKLLLFLGVVAPGAAFAPFVFDRLLRPSAEEGWRRVEHRIKPIISNSNLAMEVLRADEEDVREVQMLLTERKRRRAAALADGGAASGAASGAATPTPAGAAGRGGGSSNVSVSAASLQEEEEEAELENAEGQGLEQCGGVGLRHRPRNNAQLTH